MTTKLITTGLTILIGAVLIVTVLQSRTGESGMTKNTVPQPEKKVLHTHLAGTWFTASPDQLRSELKGYLAEVQEPMRDCVQALIAPHAGYRYSGPAAAYAYHQLTGKQYQRVFIIGPSHRVHLPNRLSVPPFTHYATPLGESPLDMPTLQALLKTPSFVSEAMVHEGEHSVQIQVPFIQQVLGLDVPLVPIVVGQLDAPTIRTVAQTLKSLIGTDGLLVASTDFTHYGPRFDYIPFDENIPENLKQLDLDALELIKQKDLEGFLQYCEKTGATICGKMAMGILIAMLEEDSQIELLKYDTSGAMEGDYSHSVSYVSAVVTGTWQPPTQQETAQSDKPQPAPIPTIVPEDRQALLKLARGSLTHFLQTGQKASPQDLGITITPGMEQVMGAFVTLHANGNLRGCIGEIIPHRPLYQAVLERAIDSGINDHRFPRVTLEEVKNLHFEISALTPPQPIPSHEDIVIGKHGILLNKRGARSVFLPQVATEQGWDLETTLAQLAHKAGLGPNDWREDTSFEVFEAIVFGEEQP